MGDTFEHHVGTAILGIDTLWGGDVMCPSGTGRFIADSWFSNEPLPAAYTHPSAARVRETGGVSAKAPDSAAIRSYLDESGVDIPAAIEGLRLEARHFDGLRAAYVTNLADCVQVMWDLAMEILGRGPAVPYERCVISSTGQPPAPSDPREKRDQVAKLLGKPGANAAELLTAVDEWRQAHRVPIASVQTLGASAIAYFDELTERNVVPHLPAYLKDVPRANIEFLPIQDAWFSGSMNYLGRARKADGSPEYEATYEINASLEISVPEFMQLVSHEVVPGHVTTFAYLQNLYWRKMVGFEASVLTMNTRAATLFEGIANNAILMAYGVTEIEDLPYPDLRLGVLLALLQDDAKNQASYMTWHEKAAQPDVARTLRNEYLVSEERAQKLSASWGVHPLLGRMYLPAYRAGTDKVAALRRTFPSEAVLPALFGCAGLVDITTIDRVLVPASGK
ncbi:MAG: hypothetical protein ABL995_12565 [Bryobacteraceae bacterium]